LPVEEAEPVSRAPPRRPCRCSSQRRPLAMRSFRGQR
jgi:hypothetical protein